MHPRDMFLAENGALALDSTDQEFALAWYRRGVMAEREACAKVCEQTGDTTGECPEMAGYCADAIRMRSNV